MPPPNVPKTRLQLLLRSMMQSPSTFSPEQAYESVTEIMDGKGTMAQMAGFLTALRAHHLDHRPEIVAACGRALREHAFKVPLEDYGLSSDDVVDIVGTGGDGHNTFNVSTAAGIVASAAGARVAKHGNRAASSSSGSADLLEALDCRIGDLQPDQAAQLLSENGYCFLFAQTYHPAMRHVAPIRKELGFPTVFNLLGPLANPSRPGRMVVGVASPALGPLMLDSLRLSGVKHALVVCGAEGLDEISPAGPSHVWSLDSDGSKKHLMVQPSDFGLPAHPLSEVVGGSAAENAEIFREILAGRRTDAVLDFILLNAAAVLVVAGKADDWTTGVAMAREAITSGRAQQTLDRFAASIPAPQ